MDEAALARAVLDESKLVLADVVFPWCGPSTAWKRDFTIAAAQAKKPDAQIHRHHEVVFAYIDATEHRYLGRRLGAECGSRPNFQLSVFKKDEGGVEQPTKVKVTCEDAGHCWFKLHQIADQYSRPLMDFTDARLMFLPVLGFFFNRLGV